MAAERFADAFFAWCRSRDVTLTNNQRAFARMFLAMVEEDVVFSEWFFGRATGTTNLMLLLDDWAAEGKP